jgi:hypothetical protein
LEFGLNAETCPVAAGRLYTYSVMFRRTKAYKLLVIKINAIIIVILLLLYSRLGFYRYNWSRGSGQFISMAELSLFSYPVPSERSKSLTTRATGVQPC